MTLNPHIETYLQLVESGELRTCREQKALAALVRRVFGSEDIHVKAEQLEHYISMARYFDYPKFFEWQAFLFALHLCTYRADGLPRFPDMLCLQGRGAGKDGTIAVEAVCLASPYNGIKKYDVDICALNEEQAMRPVNDIIEAFDDTRNKQKLSRYFRWTKETVRCLNTRAAIKGRTNNPNGKDGMRSGIVIFNELHQYEDYRNINVFTTGLGKKPHPRRSYYTTNGDVRGGPLDDLMERSEEILIGGEPDCGFLPFICKLDEREEVHDPANWEKAVPGLRYLPSLYTEIEKEYAEWKRSPATLPAFMSKRFNLPDNNSEIQVTDYENIKATNKPLPDLEGQACTVGIDYASVRDFVSVNLHFKTGDIRCDINHTWVLRKSKDILEGRIKAPLEEWERLGLLEFVDESEIQADSIAEYIKEAGQKYYIVGIALDSFRYQLMRRALMSIGFDTDYMKNIHLVRPSDIMKVQPVIDSCFTNQYFVWGDNPVLRWAANNTKLVRAGKKEGTDTGNFYYAKIESKSRKTDPFMAVVASAVIEELLDTGITGDLPDLGGVITW